LKKKHGVKKFSPQNSPIYAEIK